MKTIDLKEGIILLAALFVSGITLSCTDDDEGKLQDPLVLQEEIKEQNHKPSQYEVGNFVEHINNVIASVHYNQTLGEWYLRYHIPNTIDYFRNCYPSELHEAFQHEGFKVLFSGDVYDTDIKSEIAGVENLRVVLTSIRECNISSDNNLLLISSETFSETGIVYKSFGNKEKEIRYRQDESADTIYHLHFGCNIISSSVFYMLKIDIQNNTGKDFKDLSIGSTFDNSELFVHAYYTPTWTEAILKGTKALTGQMTIANKEAVDGQEIMTLELNDFKFDAIDHSCVYSVNGTIDFPLYSN